MVAFGHRFHSQGNRCSNRIRMSWPGCPREENAPPLRFG
ncbi:hypothetical protein COLO4_08482 [Corchorus olitorius]|uniref:Uncharacterized protein n=1 Tax=Corchorus olitorius TaxID=93759 RepID=A0A1R3KFM2_9ROSI|nr:hypothetical protein COLO4_08482 [Corchorus olitorius]